MLSLLLYTDILYNEQGAGVSERAGFSAPTVDQLKLEYIHVYTVVGLIPCTHSTVETHIAIYDIPSEVRRVRHGMWPACAAAWIGDMPSSAIM